MPPRKQAQLKNLRIDEVSVVDAGGNQHSHMTLAKRASTWLAKARDAMMAALEKVVDLEINKDGADYNAQLATRELWGKFDALQSAVRETIEDDEITDKPGTINTILDQFHADLMQTVAGLQKNHGAGGATNSADNPITEDDDMSTDTRTPVEKAQAAQLETITKALESVTKLVEEQSKVISELREERADEAIAKRAEAIVGEFGIAKAADAAKILKKLGGPDTDEGKAFIATLKTANGIAEESGLFEEFGKMAEDDEGADQDPADAIQKRADEIFTKSAGKLTKAQSYVEALKENPDRADATLEI